MKGFESEVTYRFDDHWHAKLSMTYLDAKMSSPKRLTGNARMNGLAELFYTTGKDNPWTMTRYNQWYRIISTAMGKITPTARRTSSSPRTLARTPTFMPVWTTFLINTSPMMTTSPSAAVSGERA